MLLSIFHDMALHADSHTCTMRKSTETLKECRQDKMNLELVQASSHILKPLKRFRMFNFPENASRKDREPTA